MISVGGTGSGRQGGRHRCEYCLAIDVRDWQRRQLLDPPGVNFLLVQVQTRNGERLCNIRVEVEADYVVLNHMSESGVSDVEPIELARTPCHYGGSRPWFVCPSCNRRCAKLFFRRERFLCRVCHRLGYVSQLAASAERPRIMAQRIRRRLGMDPPNLTLPFPARPEGMPWRTYYRLRAKGERYERRALANLAAWLERARGR